MRDVNCPYCNAELEINHDDGYGYSESDIHQHSVMGGIISDLKKKSETLMVHKFYPSTKTCFSCSKINKISLKERIYSCSCGYQQDRDIHSARNILREGLKQISMEHRNTMLGEDITSVFLDASKNVSSYSLKQEASKL